MATITPTTVVSGPFTPTVTSLTASDTLTYKTSVRQTLILENTTGAGVTVTIDGAGSTTISVQGYGSIDVSAGKGITVPANGFQIVTLESISAFLQGAVAVTGGTGVKAILLEG